MRKDIKIPEVENVHIAAVKEWDKDFTDQQWYIHIINAREEEIDTVLVMSRGNNDEKKTSTLRHNLGNITAKTVTKVELISLDVLSFSNEYWVTYFAGNRLFEKRFFFQPHDISDKNVVSLPVMDCEGVLAK